MNPGGQGKFETVGAGTPACGTWGPAVPGRAAGWPGKAGTGPGNPLDGPLGAAWPGTGVPAAGCCATAIWYPASGWI